MKDHRNSLQRNETRTRMSLIDPLLCMLGWDVSDPELVTPEYTRADSSVGSSGWAADYALLRPDGHPAAVVEAKRLGEPLATHRMQMLNYANAWGIEYAGLTDGDRWELYRVFEPGRLEERRILAVAMLTNPAVETALRLLVLWRSNLTRREPSTETEVPVLNDQPPAPTVPSDEAVFTPQPRSSDWIALSDYHPTPNPPCPRTIRFWDGEERDLDQWHEVLTLVAEKLHETGHLTADRVPVKSSPGSATCFVNTRPAHPTGRPFGSNLLVGDSLYVNTDLNAGQIRSNTRKLLLHCNLDPADVNLRVTQ